MRSGNRWLIAGLAGITLALPSIPCAAQGNAGANPGGGAGRPNSLGEATQMGGRTGTGTGAATGTNQQGSFQPPAPIRPGQTISVLAFPFGFTAESDTAAKPPAPGSAVAGVPDAAATGLTAEQQHMSEYLTGIVKAGFLATPAYTVMTYHPQSSLVARALKDNILTNAQNLDVVSPATGTVDIDRARVLTNRLGIQAFLVGNMDVKTTPKSNTVEITLETQLINSATGEVLRSAAVSGAAAGAEGVALQTVQDRAALETAQKVLPAMGIQLQAPRPVEAPVTGKGKSRGSKTKASSAPKREPKASSNKDERKAADEARKQEERQAEAQRKEQRRAAEKAREAEKEARKAAEKASREAKRQAEKSREQEKHAAASSSKKEGVKPAVQTDNATLAPHPSTIPAAQTAQAPVTAQAPAATAAPAASAVPNTVVGRADSGGYPVPYGYAAEATSPKLPARDRNKLKVPAWLGVAGFLTGLSFLL